MKRGRTYGTISAGLAAFLLMLLSACFLFGCGKKADPGTAADGSASGKAAASETPAETYEADPEDTSSFCLMVYMIGSDLESMGGSASEDIMEMLKAQRSDRLKIVLQTGGALAWQNELTGKDNGCRRFLLGKEEEPELLTDLGVVNMAKPEALTDFIRFASESCPSDRYGLILWDHGAGTLMGYGIDENFSKDMLEIGDLQQAISDSGMHFAFIGFDACLMSTVEVAAALEQHADYLIASEETEPAGGWSYTPFLSMLAARPGIDMKEIAPRIVDDFVNDPNSTKYDNNTLAVLDLHKLGAVQAAVDSCIRILSETVNENYDTLSLCRSRVRSYGGGIYELVDLIDLMEQLPVFLSGKSDIPPAAGAASKQPDSASAEIIDKVRNAAGELQKALSDMIVYTRSMDERSSGLALYFPYMFPDRYASVTSSMQEVGYSKEYFSFFDSFLNYVVAEQERADVQPVAPNIKTALWYRPEEAKLKEETYIDPSTLILKEGSFPEGDFPYIDLKGRQWLLIDQIENVIYAETEEYGRLELGCMNLQHTLGDSGDPYYDFDGTWMALESRIVPYYEAYYTLNEEDSPYSYGFIPAELHGRDISILVWYSIVGEEGVYIPKVLGYRREPVMSFAKRSSVIDISAGLTAPDKGVHAFREGDEITLYAYREDGSKVYPYDVPIIYHEKEGLYVIDGQAVEDFAGGRFDSLYQQIALRDIFNNTYLCEGVRLSYDWQQIELSPEVNSPGTGAGPASWEGPVKAYSLMDDYDVTVRYPSDLFEETTDWEWGEPNIVSRDGRVRIYLEALLGPEEFQEQAGIEEGFAMSHEFSRENLAMENDMFGQRYLYHEDDGQWYLGQIAGMPRMRGGVYGYMMQVWSETDPDEEMMNAILYIGNSFETGN